MPRRKLSPSYGISTLMRIPRCSSICSDCDRWARVDLVEHEHRLVGHLAVFGHHLERGVNEAQRRDVRRDGHDDRGPRATSTDSERRSIVEPASTIIVPIDGAHELDERREPVSR